MSSEKIAKAIQILSEIDAADLDRCSVEDLAQLQYWLSKYQGSIFVKTVGRLASLIEKDKS